MVSEIISAYRAEAVKSDFIREEVKNMSTQRNQVLSVKEARNFLINYQGLNTVCRYTQEKGVNILF